MQIIKAIVSFPATLVRKLSSTLVSLVLPERGKRILFMSTLFLTLTKDQTELTTEKLRALNEALKLVNDTDALRPSELLYARAWDSTAVNSCVSGVCEMKPEDEGRLKRIVSLSPKCIRYNRERMINDVRSVWQLSKVLA